MIKQKSCGFIIIDESSKYLLLKKREGYYDFPKGHVEEGENELQTAKRELYEETGIKNMQIFEGFRETIHYRFKFKDDIVDKEVVFFLAKAVNKQVYISNEHTSYNWFNHQNALQVLKFKNAKKILINAEKFVKQKDGIDWRKTYNL